MGKKYKVFTCGYYLEDGMHVNGQSIRTETITRALENKLGNNQVKRLSYAYWKRNPFRLLRNFANGVYSSESVIIFPDSNAMKFIAPLALILGKLFGSKVYYNVIGGWLPEYLHTHSNILTRILERFDGLFVQTKYLKDELNTLGISKITVFPNFKDIKLFGKNEIRTDFEVPYKCIFISRVFREKGIEYLIHAIERVNSEKTKFCLDIYGPIEEEYKERFEEVMKTVKPEIRYCGVLDPAHTSETAVDYFLHIFPTVYNAEGFAGCVIDTLFAGVPTLASKWPSFDDVIDEGETGLSFSYGDEDALVEALETIYEKPNVIIEMREACLEKAKEFTTEAVIGIMTSVMGV